MSFRSADKCYGVIIHSNGFHSFNDNKRRNKLIIRILQLDIDYKVK